MRKPLWSWGINLMENTMDSALPLRKLDRASVARKSPQNHGGAIFLRKAAAQDSQRLWAWRNHPEVRKNFFNDQIVPWEEHQGWYDKKLRASSTKIYVAAFKHNDVGVIRFDIDENKARVSVTVDPKYFGQGFGVKIIQLGTEAFWEEDGFKRPIIAEIKTENSVSQKAFSRAGYRLREEVDGKVIYEKCAA